MKTRGSTFRLTARRVTWMGIVIDAALACVKIWAGIVCASKAILADGLHSASDLVTDLAVLAGVQVAARPADRSHPYGHRRVTTLVGMFIGAVLLAAGGWIAFNAIASLPAPAGAIRPGLPFVLAAAAVPVKELLYQLTRRVGRRESNIALLANAWHHRTDAFTSVAAAAGLAGVLFGGPQWRMLDALTGLVLSAFLAVIAGRIILASASELIDSAPSAETVSGIERAVAQTTGVRSFHACRTRQVGGKVEMDIHVQVDPSLSVRQGHDIASAVRQAVMTADNKVIAVVVHVEPAE